MTKWYKNNRAKAIARSKAWYYAHRESRLNRIKELQSTPEYKKKKRDYDLSRRTRMGEEYLKQHRDYYDQNKEKIKANKRTPEGRKKRREVAQKIFRTKPNSRLAIILRNRIRSALKAQTKKLSSIELTGCSMQDLKIYLESKFLPGMCWDNHALKGWHIDHIIPCSSFNLSDPEEQKKCFHFTNLQPMWWIDNLRKSNSVSTKKRERV